MGRRLIFVLLFGLGALAPAEATRAMWIERTFFEVLRAADAALVVRVDSTGGPRYGEWAQVSVRQRLKGAVPSDTIRLPFEYQERPSLARAGRVWQSTALDRTFRTGQRLLVLVVRRPLTDPSARHRRENPYGAVTRYRVYPYPSHAHYDLDRTTVPVRWAAERLLRAERAETAAAQADALRPLLTHEADRVRRYGAGAARELAPAPLAPLLLRRFAREDDRRARERITQALVRLEHPDVTPTLLDAVPGYEPALQALNRRADPAARQPLMALYEATADTAEAEFVQDLLWAIESHVRPADLPTLRRWYDAAATVDRRKTLLHLIAATGAEPGRAFLSDVLATGTPSALPAEVATIAGRDSLHALAPALLDRFAAATTPEVRRPLISALSRLDHPGITPALLDAAPTNQSALRALARRPDTTLASSLIRLYETVADTAGVRTMRAFQSALQPHLTPEHAPVVARWYEWAETPERRRVLLSLLAPLRTATSDSLLAAVVRDGETDGLRRAAAQLMRQHGTRHPDALVHALQHDESPQVQRAALRALGATGPPSSLDAIVDYAPSPCAVPDGPGVLTSVWQTLAGWVGEARRPDAPWSPTLFDVLRQMGTQASPSDRAAVRAAVASYLSCPRFDEVRLLAAKTLVFIDPGAARSVLRDRRRWESTPRVQQELQHLTWICARIDAAGADP
jgi:HEAT repeat protein